MHAVARPKRLAYKPLRVSPDHPVEIELVLPNNWEDGIPPSETNAAKLSLLVSTEPLEEDDAGQNAGIRKEIERDRADTWRGVLKTGEMGVARTRRAKPGP